MIPVRIQAPHKPHPPGRGMESAVRSGGLLSLEHQQSETKKTKVEAKRLDIVIIDTVNE